jgi:hypothetical protein
MNAAHLRIDVQQLYKMRRPLLSLWAEMRANARTLTCALQDRGVDTIDVIYSSKFRPGLSIDPVTREHNEIGRAHV